MLYYYKVTVFAFITMMFSAYGSDLSKLSSERPDYIGIAEQKCRRLLSLFADIANNQDQPGAIQRWDNALEKLRAYKAATEKAKDLTGFEYTEIRKYIAGVDRYLQRLMQH